LLCGAGHYATRHVAQGNIKLLCVAGHYVLFALHATPCEGRPTAECSLPCQDALILPQSLNPDVDLRRADRLRPSKEAVMAQKGPDFHQCLLESAMHGMRLVSADVLLAGHPEDIDSRGDESAQPGRRIA
jgi:hypothetical protein